MLNRVIMMAGGTGGHVFPALAVAHALKNEGVEVSWLGTRNGLEADIVPKAGIEIDWITVSGLRGNGLAGWLLAPFKLLKAASQAAGIMRRRKPDLVIGMGGFVTGPGGVMAWLMGKPLIIHEQNAIPGMTNRILSKFAKRVLEAFPGSFTGSTSAVCIGNPVRVELQNVSAPESRLSNHGETLHLLVVGGSLGAMALNITVPECLQKLQREYSVEVWHQTGKKHLDVTQQHYRQANVSGKVVAFIDDMAEAYAWADVVLCRAGALTISELAAAGVASILVPFPHAVDDHQTFNARYLVDAGAARLVPQDKLTADSLGEILESFIKDKSQVLAMSKAAYAKRQIDATDKVLSVCREVVSV